MHHRLVAGGLAAVLALGVAPVAGATTLLMETIETRPPNAAEGVPRPESGMSMEAVRAKFGEPARTEGPVGEPPITRWVYDRFTVYFEHQRVLHSVLRRGEPTRTGRGP